MWKCLNPHKMRTVSIQEGLANAKALLLGVLCFCVCKDVQNQHRTCLKYADLRKLTIAKMAARLMF